MGTTISQADPRGRLKVPPVVWRRAWTSTPAPGPTSWAARPGPGVRLGPRRHRVHALLHRPGAELAAEPASVYGVPGAAADPDPTAAKDAESGAAQDSAG